MPHAALHSPTRQAFANTGPGLELDAPTPAQVREWVSDLFRQDQISLAVALAEAGLALYPDSEDVLVIAALVAEVQQNWAQARHLLEHLIAVQGGSAPAEVWCHLVRVLHCQHDTSEAFARLDLALQQFPEHPELCALRQEFAASRAAAASPEPSTPNFDVHAGIERQKHAIQSGTKFA